MAKWGPSYLSASDEADIAFHEHITAWAEIIRCIIRHYQAFIAGEGTITNGDVRSLFLTCT